MIIAQMMFNGGEVDIKEYLNRSKVLKQTSSRYKQRNRTLHFAHAVHCRHLPADRIFSDCGSDGMIPCAAVSALHCIVNGEENPFPPICDAAYCQYATRGLSHGHRQHAQKIGKDCVCGSGDIFMDRQTDRQTH